MIWEKRANYIEKHVYSAFAYVVTNTFQAQNRPLRRENAT